MTTAPTQQSGVSLADDALDWRTAFRAILEDEEPEPTPSSSRRGARTGGFVVEIPNADDLRPVAELCATGTRLLCATYRVRVTRAPVIGTLIAAFLGEVERTRSRDQMSHGEPAGLYELVDAVQPPEWVDAIDAGWLRGVLDDKRSPHWTHSGTLDRAWVDSFLNALGDPTFVRPDRRVVLLCEVADPLIFAPDDASAAASAFLTRLPDRVGVVFAGTQLPASLVAPPNGRQIVVPPQYERARHAATRFKIGALRSDRPSVVDRLGVRTYADAIASFVLLPQTTPLTIGIHGPWGKGKSSFMQMIDRALVEQALVPAGGGGVLPAVVARARAAAVRAEADPDDAAAATARDRAWAVARAKAADAVVCVDFNAWRFEDATQLWAGLASTITEALEHALPRGARLRTPFAHALRRRRLELALDVALPLVALVVAVGAVVFAGSLPSDVTAKLAAIGGGTVAVWIVAHRIHKTLEPVSSRLLSYMERPDYRDRMGYQHVVLDDLRFVHRRLRAERPGTRVVVFIDDLDRCAPEKIMEILQAVNLILGESDFFVFLGIDTLMIERAIVQHYRDEAGRDTLPPDFAERYLRKILQLNFHLPPASAGERASYLTGLLSVAADADTAEAPRAEGAATLQWDLEALGRLDVGAPVEVEDTAVEAATFQTYAEFVDDNPRELKRLVNVHRLVKILLQGDGGVEFDEERQAKLVKWLIFCAGCPEFVDDVVDGATREMSNAILTITAANGDGALRAFAERDPVLTGDDIADSTWLPRAAAISQLVRRD